jgi:putative flippase GtrA
MIADIPRRIIVLMSSDADGVSAQLLRYTLVGALAFVFDFVSLFGLTHYLGVYYLVSAGMAFLVGLSVNYILSVTWVFKKRSVQTKWLEFLIFALIGAVGLALNEVFIWFFTEITRFHYLVSKVGSTVLVYLWNFFGRKFALFR